MLRNRLPPPKKPPLLQIPRACTRGLTPTPSGRPPELHSQGQRRGEHKPSYRKQRNISRMPRRCLVLATHVADQALQWGQCAASDCGCGQKPVSQSKLLDHMATYKPAAPTSRQGTHQPRHPSRPRDQGTHQGTCASLYIVRSQKFSWPRRQQCEWRHRHNAINPALWLALSSL